MNDLAELELQLSNYNSQRTNHLTMFNQFSGAIAVLEELIKKIKCPQAVEPIVIPEEA